MDWRWWELAGDRDFLEFLPLEVADSILEGVVISATGVEQLDKLSMDLRVSVPAPANRDNTFLHSLEYSFQ